MDNDTVQKRHLIIIATYGYLTIRHMYSENQYLVVRLAPSARSSASIVIACAGQIASHNLQAIHLSSPDAYLRKACSPLNLGDNGPFSNG